MKKLFFTAVALLVSVNTYANTTVSCVSYDTPKNCVYDAWELRGWDCGGKRVALNERGLPYDTYNVLKLSVNGGKLSAVETKFNLDNTPVGETVLAQFSSVTCIASGVVNCESNDRVNGVYLTSARSQDGFVDYSLVVRAGADKDVSEYSNCK